MCPDRRLGPGQGHLDGHDVGGGFYTRLHPDKAKNRALDQLRKMGYDVTLNPLADAG